MLDIECFWINAFEDQALFMVKELKVLRCNEYLEKKCSCFFFRPSSLSFVYAPGLCFLELRMNFVPCFS